PVSADLDISDEATAKIPKFLAHVPNIDHRYGNGKAHITGIGIFGNEGDPVSGVAQGHRICVRISVEFREDVPQPNIGFMLRNRLGQDVTGTKKIYEGVTPIAVRDGDSLSVYFLLMLPDLH